ncbi:atherin-like [Schistocerca piceifrons]|uniref:atherin-like n=1 Tax=Schistocerca piceifrons TaxID=274613 RepID=UPI001F5F8529|nr:atherin-like [Schistocerca piceifrons]
MPQGSRGRGANVCGHGVGVGVGGCEQVVATSGLLRGGVPASPCRSAGRMRARGRVASGQRRRQSAPVRSRGCSTGSSAGAQPSPTPTPPPPPPPASGRAPAVPALRGAPTAGGRPHPQLLEDAQAGNSSCGRDRLRLLAHLLAADTAAPGLSWPRCGAAALPCPASQIPAAHAAPCSVPRVSNVRHTVLVSVLGCDT